jgi:cyclohexanecarboxylate-CoA ligase
MKQSIPPASTENKYITDGLWTDEVLMDRVAHWVKMSPDAPFLLDRSACQSWREFDVGVRRLAGGLRKIGVDKGDVIAVQLPNTVEFVTSYLAICSLGAIMQTIHMPYRRAELSSLLAHGKAKAIICLGKTGDYSPAAAVNDLRPELPRLKHVIAVGTGAENCTPYAELAAGTPLENSVKLSSADPFLLLYTSGTTAAPKGVPHAYRNFLCNSRLCADELEVAPGEIVLSLAPMTHLYGLFSLHLALMNGGTVSLLPAFAPDAFAKTVEAHRVQKIFAAPAHLVATINNGLMEIHDFSSVRFICLSGSAVPPALARDIEDRLPNGVAIQLWGMSEMQAGAFGRINDPVDTRHNSAGRASPATELRVVDDENISAQSGSEGRLQMRGPSLFPGYLNHDDATAESFTSDGWFETGDTARIDTAGCLTITGRVKEIINRGGIKFNPIDVEFEIDKLPGIERSAIVPYPDDVLGERACVFVVKADNNALDLGAITAHLENAGVAKFKWPERLQFVDAMPLTPTQKIMRAKLVAQLETPD